MHAIEEHSTITAKGQTTIPRAIRQALGVQAGDSIAFRVVKGRVIIEPVREEHEDPAIQKFLKLLGREIETNPKFVKPFPEKLAARARALTKGMKVDLDEPIEGPVSL